MTHALIKSWMTECPDCMTLMTKLSETVSGPALIEVAAIYRAQWHIVGAHFERLPVYVLDCDTCQEWVALEKDMLAAGAAVVLANDALLHRAGHLLYDRDPMDIEFEELLKTPDTSE